MQSRRGVRIGAYQAAILGLLTQKETIRIVVVGANDGKHNDPLYGVLKARLFDRVDLVLFEPQKSLTMHLSDNLGFVPGKHIFSMAIGSGNGSEAGLHVIREAFWSDLQPDYAKDWPDYRAPTGVASTDREHVCRWVAAVNPDVRPEEAIEEITVPALPLDVALERNGMPPGIDVLQVDAEGMDDAVLHNSGLDATRPAVLYYEQQHLPPERCEKLRNYLRGHGYCLIDMGENMLALHGA